MKHFFLFIFSSALLSFSANARASHPIAVYNVDSVIAVLPEYPAALSKFLEFDSLIGLQDSAMQAELRRKTCQFAVDSSKFSQLIKEVKGRELQYLEERLHEFREQAFYELENKRKELLQPLKEKIAAEAAAIGKQNAFLAVICEEGFVKTQSHFDDWVLFSENDPKSLLNQDVSKPLMYTDPGIKTVNITGLLIAKLKKN